ncbi:MAG: WG repeat-containing protein [Acidobacteria bacterium]|nr:WG repeat-containing protein [Acidobacteriota bacterium]
MISRNKTVTLMETFSQSVMLLAVFLGSLVTATAQTRAADLNKLFGIPADGRLIVVDNDGNVHLEFKAESIFGFEESCDCAWAEGPDNKWGVIDAKGKWLVQPKFFSPEPYQTGRYRVTRHAGDKGMIYQFVDLRGEPVFGEYEQAYSFKEGLAAIRINGKWGFIDERGKLVIPAVYDNTSFFSEGLAYVAKGGDEMFIRPDGSTAFTFPSDTTSCPSGRMIVNGRTTFCDDDFKAGIVDDSGRIVLPPTYDKIEVFSEGLAPFEQDHAWGYLDLSGRPAIRAQFDEAQRFASGLAAVEINGKWGFIDKTGRLVIAAIYDSIRRPFSKGIAWVELDGRNVFINEAGDLKFTVEGGKVIKNR